MRAPEALQPHSAPDDSDEDADATGRRLEAWERAYDADRSWEELEEDECGRLRAVDPTANLRAKRCAAALRCQLGVRGARAGADVCCFRAAGSACWTRRRRRASGAA